MAVVIVTGASSGIGEATALRLGRPGMTVVPAARRAAELRSLGARIEGNGAAAVERALQRPRRRIVVPVKYRAAIVPANALPGADQIYAGKAAAGRELTTR